MTDDPFPFRRDFADGRFAYVAPLTYGRGRINVTRADDPMGVDDAY